MRYIELTENYSPEEDKSIVAKLSDTRTIRLTLRQLSKLRKIRDHRNYEKLHKSMQIKTQYGGSSDSETPEL
ncbi:hypothetical protein N9E09_01590 [bacterium]|jgi:hypothetical protein|nr:hypothetical protein [bacterium]